MLLAAPSSAEPQVVLDRADPTISARALPRSSQAPAAAPALVAPPASDSAATLPQGIVTPRAITVRGSVLPPEAFADVIAGFVGRPLDKAALSKLAGDVASVARKRGYPFATASIPSQAGDGGILRVTLDYGQIDAVRVVGTINRRADQMLSDILVTGKPVRQSDLERAILLVGDMPGMSVKGTRLLEQNGFHILLVTVAHDRASGYVQIDNRGTREIGPVRATALASVRGVLAPGDEAALLVANTPLHPSEFIFLRGRYTMPALASGDTLTFSGSYGRSYPGGALRTFKVIGHSVDGAVSYSRSLIRSRRTSLVGTLEFRHLEIDQSLLGTRLRNERLDTATATLDGVTKAWGGTVRGQVIVTWGLPLPGATRQGDPQISRVDGDGRFVTLAYFGEWVRPLGSSVSVALGSSGQWASRPLLATAEFGVGGPAFGRAYDYSDRTGDNGIAASAELRVSVPPPVAALERLQLYAFADAGVAHNLRGGVGGGTLSSSGGGVRLGLGRSELALEAAQPITPARVSTGRHNPRASVRLSRVF
jgi:hemolysin activation/secretion protein